MRQLVYLGVLMTVDTQLRSGNCVYIQYMGLGGTALAQNKLQVSRLGII